MTVACVRFPGTNGERELVRAFETLGERVVLVDQREETLPSGTDRVVLPGGFSHGDALRAGALAARAPLMAAVRAHAWAGGAVLGICNGFQILCEAGLLPGTLLPNATGRFVARRARVAFAEDCPLARYFDRPLELPIAHAVGRWVPPLPAARAGTGEERDRQPAGAVALRYHPDDDPNLGGSGAAGVLGGPRGNVLGLMPHPERGFEALVGRSPSSRQPVPDGRLFFEAILRYDRERP